MDLQKSLSPDAQEVALPRIIGSVPEEYRHLFTGLSPGVYKGEWRHGRGDSFTPDMLQARIRPFAPVVKQAVELGGLDLQEGECIRVRIVRAWSDTLATGRGMHSDWLPHLIPFPRYRRVIVGDQLGTCYEDPNGDPQVTPDFDMLLINGQSQHAAQDPERSVLRTRLQVTRDIRSSQIFP